ncbi:hypothetical protein GCM10011375_11000 [Hymenobacter qilianensis]|uniref:Uncharacterized protein n=2 Tax=Hymenobacter qilianensis TaxID=1385715 RepID=A0ACB5PP24_9BACT|nr:CHRD domain-containing protein [Hymenobacter qilianensis]QNP53319.1 CHRD domain-containing protein [Hymenobacter qilianensis]GGF57659.1 hypothetical protein GCM10011375_11000 [Hymenobacter qilianensis]
MLQKLTSGFLLLLSLGIVSACDQFDLDDLRKKAPPSPPDIFLSAKLTGSGAGAGSFTGTYNHQTNVLDYTVAFGIVPYSIQRDVLHLHRGTPATGGPIAYTLPTTTNGTITLTEADEALLLNGGLYIDAEARLIRETDPLTVTSRGTIVRQSPTPAPVPGPEIALTAQVNGSQVVPPSSFPETATFHALYNKDTNVLTYYSVGGNFSLPADVHLHRGTPGTTGPIIVELPFLLGFLSQGEATIPEADEAALLSSGTYVDFFHNAALPNGLVRGAVVPL